MHIIFHSNIWERKKKAGRYGYNKLNFFYKWGKVHLNRYTKKEATINIITLTNCNFGQINVL
jgi:hypothetical protein